MEAPIPSLPQSILFFSPYHVLVAEGVTGGIDPPENKRWKRGALDLRLLR